MNSRFERLLKPSSIAVFGGDWAGVVVERCRNAGFEGSLWPVNPNRQMLGNERCYRSLDELPGVPDACFLGVNKDLTIDLLRALNELGAGGAICFASGFGETADQDADGLARQTRLIDAAGDMPVLGPNCYGLINYLDKVTLWPDQHGGKPVERGVAIITQSSNLAINLSMQRRGLPLAYLLTAGNQAQTTLAQLASVVIEDERVSALGLHIEGFSDVRAYEALAASARRLGKRVVVLKTGVTPLGRAALMSHTRSLSGNDAAASAFIERLGMRRVSGLGEFIETLKLLHLPRKIGGFRVLSMSCSGGEAALVSDCAAAAQLETPALNQAQKDDLRAVLGTTIALANPLDYHTQIWNDQQAMQAMIKGMLQPGQAPADNTTPDNTVSANDQFTTLADTAVLVLDFPREDRCTAPSWHLAVDVFAVATQHWQGVPVVMASLPENMPESVVESLMDQNIVALCGMDDGFKAIHNAAWLEEVASRAVPEAVWLVEDKRELPFEATELSLVDGAGTRGTQPSARRASQEAWGLVQTAVPDKATPRKLDESTAKRWLNRFGVAVPVNVRLSFADVRSSRRLSRALDKASPTFTYPVVAKGLGIVHKSEANAIELGIGNRRELERAIQRIDCVGGCLIEEHVQGVVAELLVSVICDPVHGLLMTISAGGITTEVLNDSVHCLLPVTRDELDRRIDKLRCAPLLNGFRGRAVVDRVRLLDALDSVQAAAMQLGERLVELEINPLMCTASACVAVDAYIAVRDLPAPN